MRKLEQIKKLQDIFQSSKYPQKISRLAEKLGCSEKTIKRYIADINQIYDGVVVQDKKTNGWLYDNKSVNKLGVVGPWFSDGELISLSMLLTVISNISEGFLKTELIKIEEILETILKRRLLSSKEISNNIKILAIGQRDYKTDYFSIISEQLFGSKQINIEYQDFSGNHTTRNVSPQKLVYYRDNWYLDAWCHLRSGLRTFSLSRIVSIIKGQEPLKIIDSELLNNHYVETYGIFSGQTKHVAVLKFNSTISQELNKQKWHPNEVKSWLDDELILSIPYSNDAELLQDILKHGQSVMVIEPLELKEKVIKTLRKSLDLYKK